MPFNSTERLRVALYARVSTEEQRDGQTIDSQVAELERFAQEQSWPIAGTYKDEGWSGAVMGRPALDALRDEASKGFFDAVLINDVDRLARDVTHLGILKRDFEKRGLRVIFRKLPLENHPSANFMINILGSFAEFEREQIADRTRRGRRHKIEVRRQYLGSISAYGYRYIPRNRSAGLEGVLEIVPEEAAVIREIYRWVDAEGLSAHKVVERLNAQNVPTRKGALQWAKSSVLRILRNEMYAGTWHYNKHQGYAASDSGEPFRYYRHQNNRMRIRPKSEWLPLALPDSLRIISRDLWARVQEQLTRNIALSPRNEKHRYLLKGLIRCGACGAVYVGEPCHGRFYYRCARRCKRRPSVSESRIDEAVWHALETAMLEPDFLADQIKSYMERQASAAATARQTVGETEAALKRIAAEETRIFDAYRAAAIDAAQLGRELQGLAARRSGLAIAGAENMTEVPAIPADLSQTVATYCAEAASNMQRMDHSERQQLLRLLITNIIFEGDSVRIRGRLPVKLTGSSGRSESPTGIAEHGRIATTESYPAARNVGGEKLRDSSNNMRLESGYPPFEVEQFLVKPDVPQPKDANGKFVGRKYFLAILLRQLQTVQQPRFT